MDELKNELYLKLAKQRIQESKDRLHHIWCEFKIHPYIQDAIQDGKLTKEEIENACDRAWEENRRRFD